MSKVSSVDIVLEHDGHIDLKVRLCLAFSVHEYKLKLLTAEPLKVFRACRKHSLENTEGYQAGRRNLDAEFASQVSRVPSSVNVEHGIRTDLGYENLEHILQSFNQLCLDRLLDIVIKVGMSVLINP